MQKKNILWIVVLVVAIVMFCIILFVIPDGQSNGIEMALQSSAVSVESVENSTDSADLEGIYKEGEFIFTAVQVRERFGSTLPEGYLFADTPVANPAQNDKLQLDILDTTGMSTDIALLFNVKEADLVFNQIALVIKEGGYKEDVTAILEWYLETFADSFEDKERASINKEYLDMFENRKEEYSVYSTDAQSVMMNFMAEESGKYYYVIISI
ncbi:MAG: hypothetical protein IJZ34_01230 [Lachnospiraceae bacterium]|nr:hypothetical protein [Lachnospiraceae bacterium]